MIHRVDNEMRSGCSETSHDTFVGIQILNIIFDTSRKDIQNVMHRNDTNICDKTISYYNFINVRNAKYSSTSV